MPDFIQVEYSEINGFYEVVYGYCIAIVRTEFMAQNFYLTITVDEGIIYFYFYLPGFTNLPIVSNYGELCFLFIQGKAIYGIVVEQEVQVYFDIGFYEFSFAEAYIAGAIIYKVGDLVSTVYIMVLVSSVCFVKSCAEGARGSGAMAFNIMAYFGFVSYICAWYQVGLGVKFWFSDLSG